MIAAHFKLHQKHSDSIALYTTDNNVFKVVHQENELSTPRTEQITYLKTFTFYIKNYATKNICGQSGFCCLNFLTYMVVFVRNR